MGSPWLVLFLALLAIGIGIFCVVLWIRYNKLKDIFHKTSDQNQRDQVIRLTENLNKEQRLNEELAQREEELISNDEELRQSLENQSNLLTEIQLKEASLSAMINNSSDLIFSFDKDFRIVDFNNAAQKFYTSKGAAFHKGVHFSEFVTPKNVAHANRVLDTVIQGEFHSTVFDIVDKDGGVTYFESYYNPIKSEQGEIFGISVMIREITERIKVEQILKASEEKYSKAFKSSPDAIIITAVSNGRIIELNDGFLNWSGFTHEDIEGKTTLELGFWDPAERELVKKELREKGKLSEFEVHLKIKSGEIRDCLMSAETIYLEGELCFVSVTRDITSKKKHQQLLLELLNTEKQLNEELAQREEELTSNEEELRQSLESQSILLNELQLKKVSLSALINNTSDIIYSLDRNLRLVEFNTSVVDFYAKLGIKLYQGIHVREYISEKNINDALTVFYRVLDGHRETAIIDVPDRNSKDGSKLFFESSYNPILNENKEVIGLSVMIREVTDRMRVVEALRSSEEKYSKWFRSSPDSIMIATMDEAVVIDVNDSFLENLELKREEVVGKRISDLNFLEDVNDIKKLSDLLNQKGRVANLEIHTQKRSGKKRIVLISSEILEIGNQKCFISMARDITQFKMAEEEIRITNEELIQVNKMMADYKLMALRSAMNPHFIFNAMNSIQYFISKNERENALIYLSLFSKLIRNILTGTVENKTTIHHEMETLQNYIELENLRFDTKFEVEYEIDKSLDIRQIEIPSLLLQPYVENAILHGLYNKTGKGKLSIKLQERDENTIIFVVEDNGVGREEAKKIKQANQINNHKSVGMVLTKERLDIINKTNNISVIINDLTDNNGKPAGTRIELYVEI